MNRGKLLATMCVTALALSTAPAWAQRGSESSGDRGGGTGSAVDRGSSSSSSPSSPSSSGSSGGGSSSSGTSSTDSGSRGGNAYTPPSSSSGSDSVSVPVRPNQAEREQGGQPRGGNPRSGGESSARAVPRGSDGTSGSPSSAERRTGSGSSDDSPSRNAVPTYSRPRDGRGTGTAVDRPAGYYGGGGSSPGYVYRYPGYYGRYYYPGYAFGLGYFYDPSWYDPYYYGGLYGGGYGGYYGSGGGYGAGYAGGSQSTGSSYYGGGPQGSLRLKIKPREGQVYVDGFFVGTVDDFDGTFQKLGIDAGGHRIEIKAPGHETISFEVLITPNETVTYKGELPRIQ
jgi:PEGA domain